MGSNQGLGYDEQGDHNAGTNLDLRDDLSKEEGSE